MLLACCLLAGCAETLLTGAAPEPPPGDKLRIYLKVITSGHLKEDWRGTEQRAEATARPLLAEVLDETNFCELINGTDLDKVMPSPPPGRWWLADELDLVRQVGKALHADYGILVERHGRSLSTVRHILVNVHTGSTFEVPALPLAASEMESSEQELLEKSWKRLYRLARKDLFETALRKGRGERRPETPAAVVHLIENAAADELTPVPAAVKRPTLAVYDFAADGPMGAAAAILADALREELLKQGKVLLVKRERVSQVLQDMAISQLGLDDDSRAIDAGKALAASQVVTGQFGVMGGSSVLQVKRIEIRSHIERFIGSTRCPQGREALLLEELPALARDIAMGL